MSLLESHQGLVSIFARFNPESRLNILYYVAFFKLKPQNVIFWLVAPSLYFKYAADGEVEERISNLWRIHKNRESRGMGGSFNPRGVYSKDDHNGDSGLIF